MVPDYRPLAHSPALTDAAEPARLARQCFDGGTLNDDVPRRLETPQGEVRYRRAGLPAENARRIFSIEAQRNHTQAELAALIDVSPTTIPSPVASRVMPPTFLQPHDTVDVRGRRIRATIPTSVTMAAAVSTSTRKSQTAINEVAATVPMTVGRFMMTWLAAATRPCSAG